MALREVIDRILTVLDEQAALDWLDQPNPALDDRRPIDLLRAGEHRRVLGAIESLAEGVFV